MKKYLLITLEVRDGENEYTIRELHTTNAKNIQLAAQIYAARFLGHERLYINFERRQKEISGWWYSAGLERACRLSKVKEITEENYCLATAMFNF